jgi:hypothetical protein
MADVDGDDVPDIVVGAPEPSAGRVYVFSAASHVLLFSLLGMQTGSYFGTGLAMGDVNGDTKADIGVGAPFYDGFFGNQGRAGVFSGSDGTLLWLLDSPNAQGGAWFGYALAMGDVDTDGSSDVAVGAHEEDIAGYPNNRGRVYVLSTTLEPTPTPPVGGIAEYPDVAQPPARQSASWGSSAAPYAAIAGAGAAAIVTLVASGWYVRRWWLR